MTSQQNNSQENNKKPVGKVSKDGQAFYASPDYLKQISQKDKMAPCVKPLLIISAIVLVWWALLCFVYLSGAWHWLTEMWEGFMSVLNKW